MTATTASLTIIRILSARCSARTKRPGRKRCTAASVQASMLRLTAQTKSTANLISSTTCERSLLRKQVSSRWASTTTAGSMRANIERTMITEGRMHPVTTTGPMASPRKLILIFNQTAEAMTMEVGTSVNDARRITVRRTTCARTWTGVTLVGIVLPGVLLATDCRVC